MALGTDREENTNQCQRNSHNNSRKTWSPSSKSQYSSLMSMCLLPSNQCRHICSLISPSWDMTPIMMSSCLRVSKSMQLCHEAPRHCKQVAIIEDSHKCRCQTSSQLQFSSQYSSTIACQSWSSKAKGSCQVLTRWPRWILKTRMPSIVSWFRTTGTSIDWVELQELSSTERDRDRAISNHVCLSFCYLQF